MESSDASIAVFNAHGKMLFSNKIAARSLGRTPEEVIGQPMSALFPPEVAERQLQGIRQVIQTGIGYISEAPSVIHGEERWFRTSVQPIRDSSGRVTSALINAVDITEQQTARLILQQSHDLLEQRVNERTAELERVKNRVEAIFNHSGDAMLLLDVVHGIQQANYTFDEMFQMETDSYFGLSLTEFIHPEDRALVAATLQQVATSHQTVHLDVHAQRQDGFVFDIGVSIAPVNRSNKPVNSLVCIVRDMTEHNQVELAVAEERNLLRTVIDAVPDFIYVKDNQHRMLLNNASHARSLGGISPREVIGKTDFDLFPAEMAAKFRADEERLFATGVPVLNTEERSIGEDGSEIWALTSKMPLRNLNGDVIGLVGVTHDVTGIKANEAALRRSQADLQSVIDSTKTAFVLLDRDGIIRLVNRLARTMTAQYYGGEMREGSAMKDYIPPRFHQNFDMRMARVLQGESLVFEEKMSLGGREMYFEFRYFPVQTHDGEIVGLNTAFEDITERKEVEAALKHKLYEEQQMQSYLRALHEISIDLARTHSLDTFYQITVEQGLQRLGFERVGMLLYDPATQMVRGTYGTNAAGDIVAEQHLEKPITELTGILQQVLSRGERFAFEEETVLFDQFEPIGTGQNAVAALWNGELLGWLAVDNALHHKPLTRGQLDTLALYALTVGSLLARKRAEFALKESEEKFRLFTESAPIATIITDHSGRIVLVNKEAEKLFGYPRDELLNKPVETLIPEQLRDLHVSHRQRYALTPPRLHRHGAMELSACRKDGTDFPADIQLSYIEMQPGPHVMSFIMDITQRKQVEQALRQALEHEKELGELKSRFVSMASHEFRTPLAAILATTETLTIYRERMTESQVNTRLDKIRGQVNHMKNIMEDVLQLARMQAGRIPFKPNLEDLDALCQEIIEEYDTQEIYRGRILYACTLNPTRTVFDVQLMRQVISNLVHNALKYSPEYTMIQVDLRRDAGNIILTVKDEGIGIPPEDLKHLFEPFHRAQNVGTISGTGLGLTITRQAVEAHRGTISVESHLNQRTIFTVIIPEETSRGEHHDYDTGH
ncbi:MAG: hypothetical protein OHK0046_18910 [Anaerolineae bacterium]